MPSNGTIDLGSNLHANTWAAFVAFGGLKDLWEPKIESEEERYGKIVGVLSSETSRRADQMRTDEDFFLDSMHRSMQELKSKYEEKEAINFIDIARWNIIASVCWDIRKAREMCSGQARVALERAARRQLRPYGVRNILLSSRMELTSERVVPVYVGLEHAPYYFGHKGGAHVFRYVKPLEPTSDGYSWTTGRITPDTNDARAMFFVPGLADPDDLPEHFQYVGQVPRSAPEYLCRLRHLIPAVVQVLDGIAFFEFKPGPFGWEWKFQRYEHPWDEETLQVKLDAMLRRWEAAFATHDPYPPHVAPRLFSNTAILEYAFLICSLASCTEYDEGNLVLLQAVMLVMRGVNLCIIRAKGGCLRTLADEYIKRSGETAKDELLSGKNTERCLIYEPDSNEDNIDIHRFFSPLHYPWGDHPLRANIRIDCTNGLQGLKELKELEKIGLQVTLEQAKEQRDRAASKEHKRTKRKSGESTQKGSPKRRRRDSIQVKAPRASVSRSKAKYRPRRLDYVKSSKRLGVR